MVKYKHRHNDTQAIYTRMVLYGHKNARLAWAKRQAAKRKQQAARP